MSSLLFTLKARRARAGVPVGEAGQAGGRILAGIGAANVKIRLKLAVTAIVAGLTLARVAGVLGVRLQMKNNSC
jgi:hypothetical protein